MKTLANLLLALSVLAAHSSCKKYDHVMPDPEVEFMTAQQLELVRSFSGLTNGDESACNLIVDPETIPDVLCNIVKEARKGSEIVFVVDNTTSMEDDIDIVKKNINKIIDCLPDGIRLGAATYGDKADGAGWYNYTPLTENYQEIKDYVNAIGLAGGGFDLPESVYDGIWETLDVMSWKDCSAPDKIIVMGDAEPHTGSLTTYSLQDVLDKAQSICPDTEFYPVIVLDL